MLSGDEVEPISSATSPFKVIFDPNKTRPHYLFVWKDVSTNVNNMNVMDIPPADLTSLISCAKEVTQAMGLGELSILSLHQGSFTNLKNCSSIHLLVKPAKYLEELRKLSTDARVYEEVASKVDHWFEDNIKLNSKWKQQDLTRLHQYIHRRNDEMNPPKFNYTEFCTISFHSTQPRIGFKLIDGEQDEEILLSLMIDFVRQQKISGSHMCICLGKSLTVYDQEFGRESTRAYLQVHIQDYYRINPHRHEWLKTFQLNSTHYEQYT